MTDRYLGRGRRAPFTQLGHWVLLAPISPQAKALYWALSAHVNNEAGDRAAWPSQDTLADILGKSQASISRWVTELEVFGAIEAERTGPTGALLYRVHETAPADYDGPESIADYYKRRAVTSSYPRVNNRQLSTGAPVHKPVDIHPRIPGYAPVDTAISTGAYKLDEQELDEGNENPPTPASGGPAATPEPKPRPSPSPRCRHGETCNLRACGRSPRQRAESARAAKPPHCEHPDCNPVTRVRAPADGSPPRRCPVCHPLVTAARTGAGVSS